MSSPKPTVVISGATGNLGPHILKAFLQEPFRQHFSKIIALTRSPESAPSQELAKLGAELVVPKAPLSKVFENVDIFINAIGPGKGGVGHKAKAELMEAAAAAGVKIYIPSEFGIDHRHKDFEHPEWDAKAAHQAKARATAMKVIAVYPGLFMEDSFGPWFGFDTKNHLWTVIGSESARVSFTAKQDVANTLASLSLLAYTEPSKVPDHLRIGGDTVSTQEALYAMSEVSGEIIQLKEEDLAAFKQNTIQTHKGSDEPLHYLRFLMGEGKLDHSIDCSNEIVNPGQGLWKWKTVRDYAKEVGGKPWCD